MEKEIYSMIKEAKERWTEIQQMELPARTAVCVLQAVCLVETEFGPVDFDLRLSDTLRIGNGAMACCTRENEVILGREYFKESSFETLETIMCQSVKNKFHTESRNSVSSILVHELCHAVWNSIERQGVKLADEVMPIMKEWVTEMDRQKLPFFLAYAYTNVFEFWAEMLTQSLCGSPNRYTKQVLAVAHKHLKR